MKVISFLKPYIIKNKSSFGFFFAATFILVLISVLNPYFIGIFIDRLTHADARDVKNYVAVLGAIWISELILSYLKNVCAAKLSTKIMYDISFSLLERVKRIRFTYFTKVDSAYLNQRINNDSNMLISFFMNSFSGLLVQIACFIFAVCALFYINMKIGLLLLVFMPLYFIMYTLLKKPIFRLSYKQNEERNLLFAKMHTQLQNVKTIKLNSWYTELDFILKEPFKVFYEVNMDYIKLSFVFSNVDKIIKYSANILVFLYTGLEIIHKRMTVGQFTMINSYFMMLITAAGYMFNYGKSYQDTLVSYERITQINNEQTEHNGDSILNRIDRIDFKNIRFGYDINRSIINEFNYTMSKGNIYTIVGENGKGKSTLLNIMAGLLQDYEGNILINHISIRNIDMYNFRKNSMSIVEQEPVLFFDDILSNISFGNSDLSELDKLIDILELRSFIDRLPDGVFSKIAERSHNLSGGEKQKIALLRALLKDTDVLILDEPNSAIDKQCSENLFKHLAKIKKDKIIIIIAHHQSFIDIADEVIKL